MSPRVAISRVSRVYRDDDLTSRGEIFQAVELALRHVGLDDAHQGTAAWNPLGDLVKRGGRIVIKPNFVTSRNLHENLEGERLWGVATHPAVLRPLLEYAWRAVGPEGRISIVDCSIAGSHFERTLQALRVYDLLEDLRRLGIAVELLDLRDFRLQPKMVLDDVRFAGRSWNLGVVVQQALSGDPRGYVVVDLGPRSYLERDGLDLSRLRHHLNDGEREPLDHHAPGRHEYSLSRTVLEADLFINVPKLKTHRKAGMTVCLKNVVGTTNKKHWLPHYRAGIPPHGDEFPRAPSLGQWLRAWLARVPLPGGHAFICRWTSLANEGVVEPILTGTWEGNDTTWRMVLDLNTILRYADAQGRLQDRPQRNWLCVVDGVVAGEGEGPIAATPKACQAILAGTDPVAVDAVAAAMMGFDASAIKMISCAEPGLGTSSDSIEVRTDGEEAPAFTFATPRGWGSLRETGSGAVAGRPGGIVDHEEVQR